MTNRPVSSWIVPLKGHAFDLEDMPMCLAGASISIQKRGEGYFLLLPTAVAGTDYGPVLPLSLEQLARINGAASVLFHSYRPIELAEGAYFGIDENGDIAQTVIPMGSTELRCKAGQPTILINGVPQSNHRLGQFALILRAAEKSTSAADALALVGRFTPSWSELYLVYELVESNVGRRMYVENWIGRNEGKFFTRTANSYTALGRAARHGKDRGDPPQEPMPQPVATNLMRTLVSHWLRSIAIENGEAG